MKPLRPNEIEEFEVSHLLGCGTKSGYVGKDYLETTEVSASAFRQLCDRDEAVASKLMLWSRAHVFPFARRHCMRALAVLVNRRSSYFRDVFFKAVKDVDDLLWFLEESILERGKPRPSKMAKEYAAQWIELCLTDEEAWAHRKKRDRHTMSLKDAVILCHPTFRGEDVPRIRLLFCKAKDQVDTRVAPFTRSQGSTDPDKEDLVISALPGGKAIGAVDRSGSCPDAFLRAALLAVYDVAWKVLLYDDVVVPLEAYHSDIEILPRGGWKPHLALREAMTLKPDVFILTSRTPIPEEHSFWKFLEDLRGDSMFVFLLPPKTYQRGVEWGLENRVITDPVNVVPYLPWLRDPFETVTEANTWELF